MTYIQSRQAHLPVVGVAIQSQLSGRIWGAVRAIERCQGGSPGALGGVCRLRGGVLLLER